ncbi:MAG: hypothetical protein ACREQJ_11575, partial [Candidatus Binatia bacterium]
MRRAVAILLAAATIATGASRADDGRAKVAEKPRFDLWHELLAARVNERGEVAYRTLDAFDRERLETFIASLAAADLD